MMYRKLCNSHNVLFPRTSQKFQWYLDCTEIRPASLKLRNPFFTLFQIRRIFSCAQVPFMAYQYKLFHLGVVQNLCRFFSILKWVVYDQIRVILFFLVNTLFSIHKYDVPHNGPVRCTLLMRVSTYKVTTLVHSCQLGTHASTSTLSHCFWSHKSQIVIFYASPSAKIYTFQHAFAAIRYYHRINRSEMTTD